MTAKILVLRVLWQNEKENSPGKLFGFWHIYRLFTPCLLLLVPLAKELSLSVLLSHMLSCHNWSVWIEHSGEQLSTTLLQNNFFSFDFFFSKQKVCKMVKCLLQSALKIHSPIYCSHYKHLSQSAWIFTVVSTFDGNTGEKCEHMYSLEP